VGLHSKLHGLTSFLLTHMNGGGHDPPSLFSIYPTCFNHLRANGMRGSKGSGSILHGPALCALPSSATPPMRLHTSLRSSLLLWLPSPSPSCTPGFAYAQSEHRGACDGERPAHLPTPSTWAASPTLPPPPLHVGAGSAVGPAWPLPSPTSSPPPATLHKPRVQDKQHTPCPG
jgi:hypothetical protein